MARFFLLIVSRRINEQARDESGGSTMMRLLAVLLVVALGTVSGVGDLSGQASRTGQTVLPHPDPSPTRGV